MPFFNLVETANKSNVVTASTAIQLLDDKKSPVVAGKMVASFFINVANRLCFLVPLRLPIKILI